MKKKACFSGFEVHQRVLVRDFWGVWMSNVVLEFCECRLSVVEGVEFGAPNFKKHATRVPT
jgi:hypothetical protein